MAFESGFQSVIWSDEPYTSQHDWKVQGLSIGAAAGIAGLGFYASTRPRMDGTRAIDDITAVSRTLGNLSPFQIGNTFRIPEWLSPFTSPDYQELSGLSTSFDRSFLEHNSTYTYLKSLTGMDDQQLRAVGIAPRMKGAEASLASSLVFEKGAVGDISGKLYSVVGNTRHLLSDNTMLLQYTGETASAVDLFAKNTPINKVAKSVFAAMDLWQDDSFSPSGVFSRRQGVSLENVERPKFIPIPGMDFSNRGTAYLRAIPAFGMERFNHLLSNIGQETFGDAFTKLSKRIGIRADVLSGPASHMYTRFGMKAAGVVGAGVLLGELDWWRRQNTFGHLGSSAVVGFGLGALTARAGFGARGGLFAGIAAFAGQQILPGFDQGIIPGIATTYALGTQARALAINPFNYYRRALEGFLPGISDPTIGVGIGVGLATAAYLKVPNTGQTIPSYLLSKFGPETFGLAKRTSKQMDVRTPKSIRDHFWHLMLDHGIKEIGGPQIKAINKEFKKNGGYITTGMRTRLTSAFYGSGMSPTEFSRKSNTFWAIAEERFKTLEAANPVNEVLKDRLGDIARRYSGKSDFVSKTMMQVEGMGEQIRHSFFGANVLEEGTAKFIKQKGFMNSFFGRAGLLFATGFAAHGLLTGTFLGSMETSRELQDIYSGKQLVEVNKGRWWELGGTPFQGTDMGQWRPHWYPLMMNRVRQTAAWGENEDNLSPAIKFFMENFTYELERRTYYDRPYPISAPAFGNIPLIGPLLGSTVGNLVKPAKLMHTGEWIQSTDGGLQFASVYDGWKREPAYNLGAHDPGIPISPYGARAIFSDFNSQFKDLGGLVGWVADMGSNLIAGEDVLFGEQPRLADAGMITSYRKKFWDMSLGGGGPIGEIVRRVLPNYTKDIERMNPIINSMPQWMPKDFQWGDPYARVAFGEGILPGAGYAQLHPELKGVDPEDYPLVYRYDILSQLAPKGKEIAKVRDRLYQERAMGYLTPAQEEWVNRIDRVVANQWQGHEFDRVDKNAIQLPGSSITQAAWSFAQKIVRQQTAPFENIIPGGFRPFQKFMGERGMIEQYEYERMYGSGGMAFWDQPFRDFIRPSMYSLAHLMGYDSKPLWRIEADALNREFDELEFYKWMSLAEQAEAQGNIRQKIQYQYQAANTRFGVNPQGSSISIYWSLPSDERKFFNSFALAQGKDRDRILEMVPSDQKHLYQSLWSRIDNDDPGLWAGSSTAPDEDYLYRQFYGMDTSSMPKPDWIGWNKDVDLTDIKVRYVDSLAADMHDYGIWEQEVRKAYSQPFLEGSEAVIRQNMGGWRGAVSRNLSEMFLGPQDRPNLNVFTSNATLGTVQLQYNDNRQGEINSALGGYLGGY